MGGEDDSQDQVGRWQPLPLDFCSISSTQEEGEGTRGGEEEEKKLSGSRGDRSKGTAFIAIQCSRELFNEP